MKIPESSWICENEMRKKAVELALEDKNLEHLLEDSKKRKEELGRLFVLEYRRIVRTAQAGRKRVVSQAYVCLF